MDGLRPGVKKTIAALRADGARVVMTTGDHPVTAEALAKQSGIFLDSTKDGNKRVIWGHKIDAGTLDECFEEGNEVVLGRLTPEQKLLVVQTLQRRSEGAVMYVGDGLNDSAAVRAADVGVAMGIQGCDIVKSVLGFRV